jgi:ABC-type branched-subunit amino acid transport system substrate-binding protein
LLSNAGFEVSPEPAKQKMAVDQAMAPFAKDRPDAVIMIAAGNAMWTALAHAREIYGQLVPIYSISIVTIEDIIKQIGIANAQGIIVSQAMPSPQGLERQMAREYLNDIKKFRKDMKPGYVTFEGYVGGRILAEALKLAGGNPTRESLLKALYGMGERNIGDIRVKYANGDRHGNDSVDVVVIGKGGIQVR